MPAARSVHVERPERRRQGAAGGAGVPGHQAQPWGPPLPVPLSGAPGPARGTSASCRALPLVQPPVALRPSGQWPDSWTRRAADQVMGTRGQRSTGLGHGAFARTHATRTHSRSRTRTCAHALTRHTHTLTRHAHAHTRTHMPRARTHTPRACTHTPRTHMRTHAGQETCSERSPRDPETCGFFRC